jgi:hypothetical protein
MRRPGRAGTQAGSGRVAATTLPGLGVQQVAQAHGIAALT